MSWLIAEDDGAKNKIKDLLSDRDEHLSVIKATLQGKLSVLHEHFATLTQGTEQLSGLEETDDTDEEDTKEMLSTLLQFL